MSTRLTKIERMINDLEGNNDHGFLSHPFDLDVELMTLEARIKERDRLIGFSTKPQQLEDVIARAKPVYDSCVELHRATKRRQWDKVRNLSNKAIEAAHAAHERKPQP